MAPTGTRPTWREVGTQGVGREILRIVRVMDAGSDSGSPTRGSCWGAGSSAVRVLGSRSLVRNRKEGRRQEDR
jgi:hypothetical protein